MASPLPSRVISNITHNKVLWLQHRYFPYIVSHEKHMISTPDHGSNLVALMFFGYDSGVTATEGLVTSCHSDQPSSISESNVFVIC